MPRTGNDNLDIREIYESLQWILPAINPNIGQIEPPSRYRRTGLIAYADGSTWNPNSQGAGYYRYGGAAWVKLLEPDDTFATSINADMVDGKHAPVYIKVTDTKTSGSNGQTLSTATWNKRDVTTEDNDDGNLVSLSSNQITLLAGTYECSIRIMTQLTSASAGHTIQGQARLQNTTDASTGLWGTSYYRNHNIGGPLDTFTSFIAGKFTIAAQKTFEIQEYLVLSGASASGGQYFGLGPEVYLIAEFWKCD